MKNDPSKLNIIKPLLFLLGFVAFVGILFFVLSILNNQRKERIYRQYAQETESYIAKNRDGLTIIFNDLFPDSVCYDNSQSCRTSTGDEIAKLISQDMKDWSSMMFIKSTSSGILYMRLSGDTREFYVYPEDKKTQIEKLLLGQVNKIPWDDYSYELPQKEVIIPVKDKDGKIIGALIRSVIEQ